MKLFEFNSKSRRHGTQTYIFVVALTLEEAEGIAKKKLISEGMRPHVELTGELEVSPSAKVGIFDVIYRE